MAEPSPAAPETVEILGIRFFQGSVEEAALAGLRGGLLVAPSAPGLAQDLKRQGYAAAVRSAEVAIPDSGYMVLLWRLLKRQRIRRISGLALMRELLEAQSETIGQGALWVMPTAEDAAALQTYLAERGIQCEDDQIYLAPQYALAGPTDPDLLEIMRQRLPEIVILAVAGGKQEPLGAWLRDELKAQGEAVPAIFCLGAAIAFLTGRQANIPPWADRLFLGWLLRLLREPRRYWRRYGGAIGLAARIARSQ
jgi:exopolysaccharide biosynthesis WecB/TagA/CpsF family protein